jgi:hypothetical protein
LVILLLVGQRPGLRSNAPALIISANPGRRVICWLTFWLDNLSLDVLVWPGVVMIKDPGCVALDLWQWVLLPVARVAEGILEEPDDRVLGRRDDLVDLRRDQTRAVKGILGDLRADPERHFGVLHHSDQIFGSPVGSHDQPLSSASTHLRGSATVLVADDSSRLGLPLAPSAVGPRAIAADDRLGKQGPALLRV